MSSVLAEISEQEEKYLICRNSKPVANLAPHVKRSRLNPHPVLSQIRIKYDAIEPLSANEWAEEP